MKRGEAQRLMEDLGKNISKSDYVDDIYLSIRGIGTKVFKNCAYFETDGYTFIWTENESFMLNKSEIGDYVIIPYKPSIKITLKKVI
jgi:hypothetical protein